MTIPLDAQIKAVQREIRYREFVYPRRVANGKMSAADADYQLEVMKAVLTTLEQAQEKERLI